MNAPHTPTIPTLALQLAGLHKGLGSLDRFGGADREVPGVQAGRVAAGVRRHVHSDQESRRGAGASQRPAKRGSAGPSAAARAGAARGPGKRSGERGPRGGTESVMAWVKRHDVYLSAAPGGALLIGLGHFLLPGGLPW